MKMKRLASVFAATALASAALVALPLPAAARVGVVISVGIPPPALPVQYQPMAPGPGYIWTPGYWSWDGAGYVWVQGAWVLPPQAGLLWTPGYWGWGGTAYIWHPGYWGPTVGFYGDVDYGFGYSGSGYDGGYWSGDVFFYNLYVNHVDRARFRHVYTRPGPYQGRRDGDWRWHSQGNSWSHASRPQPSRDSQPARGYRAPPSLPPSRVMLPQQRRDAVPVQPRQPMYAPRRDVPAPQYRAPPARAPEARDRVQSHPAQGRPAPAHRPPPPSSHHPHDGGHAQ